MRTVGACDDVSAPARRHDIETTVAVQVAHRDSIPAARPPTQPPRVRRRIELAVLVVEEEQDRAPIAREQQIRISVAVDVGEDGRRYHAYIVQQLTVCRIENEASIHVLE